MVLPPQLFYGEIIGIINKIYYILYYYFSIENGGNPFYNILIDFHTKHMIDRIQLVIGRVV